MKIPEIIAEIGVNYYDIATKNAIGLVDAAKKMIYECKESGVSIVKFQTYKAEKLAATESPSYWDLNEEPTNSQRELFSKFDKLTKEDYVQLAEYCENIGVEFMSTAFDLQSAEFINNLVKRHKIASADITNFPLLKLLASYKKPMILSVGASELSEIKDAVLFLMNCGITDITLLHCVLSYPTALANANLWKIQALRREFPDFKIGYSDHTKFSLDVLTCACFMGADVIEKHYTLDKELKGNDHYHAADPDDFSKLINKLNCLESVIGLEQDSWSLSCESQAVSNARRGVYLRKSVKKGSVLREEDFEILRPQLGGINPKQMLDYVARGIVYKQDLAQDSLLKADDLSI